MPRFSVRADSRLSDTAHVLPVLFAFTTPGKFCYRAIATFCKHVAPGGMTVEPTVQSPIFGSFPFQNITSPAIPGYMRGHSSPSVKKTDDNRGRRPTQNHDHKKGTPGRSGSHPATPTKSRSRHRSQSRSRTLNTPPSVALSSVEDGRASPPVKSSVSKIFPSKSIRRSLSLSISRARSAMRGNISTGDQDDPPPLPSRDHIPRENSDSSDVAGPRFPHTSIMTPAPSSTARSAGDPAIYHETPVRCNFMFVQLKHFLF